MELGSCLILYVLCLVLIWLCSFPCDALEKITATQFIKDPEVLVSNGSSFKLGFFSPVNSTNRYVGIWYNGTDAATPEWVANREAPLDDSSGVLKVLQDGNLAVLNGKNEVLWSSNVTDDGVYNSTAELTNDGNLVLRDNANGNILWESFQEPSDTLLRTMKVSTNQGTGQKYVLTSWRSASDPSVGRFSAGINPTGLPEILVWKDGLPYWRSAPWVGQVFVGIPDMESVYIDGYNLALDADGSYSLSFSYAHDTQKHNLVLDPGGQLRERYWDSSKASWEDDWYAVKGPCDLYGYCGKFGVCDNRSMPICKCLVGFEPSNLQEWSAGNWSNGCVRRTSTQCERAGNGSELGKGDGFIRLQTVKVPYLAQWSSAVEKDCRINCLSNCSCIAYSYYAGFGCMSWTDDLIDIEKFTSGGADLYVRVAYSELVKKRNKKVVISLAVIFGVIAIGILAFFAWRFSAGHRETKNTRNETRFGARNNTHSTASHTSPMKFQETTMFNMHILVLATENFGQSNKLGEGGFGPVFKGTLSDGNEIAVKRLSKSSGQGLEEFMNEVKVISKLQHRNLVRLLGCCVEGDEKMLVYEYMPNKSLDTYLFDEHKRKLLDWGKRFSVIEGICRGLLYLHRDSRLRIIHRDLKPSNILLDQELNPKISDFGMARIFGGNEDQANTRRVVGTYGYMSPEYAIKGQFSEKSDVFSLGIILLEIVSGKRITSYEKNGEPLSLLESAWNLWSKGDISAFIDPVVSDQRFEEQAVLCVHVGLLCLQDIANDRPAVSTVMAMLNGQISDLPSPRRPGIAESMIRFEPENVPSSQDLSSANRITITDVEGR